MDRTVEIVEIEIADHGQYFLATSQDLPEIMVAHPDIAAVYEEIPNIVRAIYRQRHGIDVLVVPASHVRERPDRSGGTPWAVIPSEIATRGGRDAH